MHKPTNFDDDLSSFRQIVVDTNNDKKERSGFEKGKFGYFYRIIIHNFLSEITSVYFLNIEFIILKNSILFIFR